MTTQMPTIAAQIRRNLPVVTIAVLEFVVAHALALSAFARLLPPARRTRRQSARLLFTRFNRLHRRRNLGGNTAVQSAATRARAARDSRRRGDLRGAFTARRSGLSRAKRRSPRSRWRPR